MGRREPLVRDGQITELPPHRFGELVMGDHPGRSLQGVREHLQQESPAYYSELHSDISRNGVQAPVLLRGRKIMDGHHRLAIADELGQSAPVGDYDNPEHYDAGQHRGREWYRKRVDLGERRASRAPRRCEGCNGLGDLDDGSECGACDGSGQDPTCICGTPVTKQPGEDWWSHLDGSIGHDGDLYGYSVAELMRRLGKIRSTERPQKCAYCANPATQSLLWAEGHGYIPTCDDHDAKGRHQITVTNHDEVAAVHKISRRWMPVKRLFGPTYGLDHRLFDGQHLRPDVARFVLTMLGNFWAPRYGAGWRSWARVYLAGSEASEWTSPTTEGNNDFDVLIGIDYDKCRDAVSALSQLSDLEITDRLNGEFRADLIPHTDPTWIPVTGVNSRSWQNPAGSSPALPRSTTSWSGSTSSRSGRPAPSGDISASRSAPSATTWNDEGYPETRPEGRTVPGSLTGPSARTARRRSLSEVPTDPDRRATDDVTRARPTTSEIDTFGSITGSRRSSSTDSSQSRAGAVGGVDARTSRSRSITTTGVAPGSAPVGSASEGFSAPATTRLFRTSARSTSEQPSPGLTAESALPHETEIGPFSMTFFVNADSYDIRAIKPYAAFDITRDSWAVKPPHLPDWSINDFPQGHALVQECWGYEDVVKAILRQPEPYRSQQADALWRHLHSDRSRAFGPQGEGWYDAGNVIEKFLDQRGIWEQLAQVHFDAMADPSKLLAPAGWSNDPR